MTAGNHGSVENHPENERKLTLEIHPFSLNQDYGRKGNCGTSSL